MKHKLSILLPALALLLALGTIPAYAGDGSDAPPPPCSQCDAAVIQFEGAE